MDGSNFISVDTATAAQAGQRTYRTGGVWESWAGRCAVAFEEVGIDVSDPRIALASAGYAIRVVGNARRVGEQVEELGVATVSATRVVDAADAESAATLDRQLVDEWRSLLNRPINEAPRPT